MGGGKQRKKGPALLSAKILWLLCRRGQAGRLFWRLLRYSGGSWSTQRVVHLVGSSVYIGKIEVPSTEYADPETMKGLRSGPTHNLLIPDQF